MNEEEDPRETAGLSISGPGPRAMKKDNTPTGLKVFSMLRIVTSTLICLAFTCIGASCNRVPCTGHMKVGELEGSIRFTKAPDSLYVLIASTRPLTKAELESIRLSVKHEGSESRLLTLPEIGQVETNWLKEEEPSSSYIFAATGPAYGKENVLSFRKGDEVDLYIATSNESIKPNISLWVQYAGFGSGGACPIELVDGSK